MCYLSCWFEKQGGGRAPEEIVIVLKLSFCAWSLGFPEEMFIRSIQNVLFAWQIQLR